MKMSGILIKSGHTFIFRKYTVDGGFVDYDITHSDLAITIDDATAVIKHSELDNTPYIDYNDEVLGLIKRGW
jgi:hypothetical protein